MCRTWTFISAWNRKQKILVLSFGLLDFAGFCCLSILAPFFPHEASLKGMSETVVGLVFSSYAMTTALSSVVMGRIIPHVGAKFALLGGTFLTGSCCMLFGTLDEISSGTVFAVFCFAVRIVEALGAAAYNTAIFTLITVFFPDDVGLVLGTMETFIGLGLSIGPAIGAGLYAVAGYKLPFFVLGGLVLLLAALNAYLVPSDTDAPKTQAGFRAMVRLGAYPATAVVGLCCTVTALSTSFIMPTLQPHLAPIGLSPASVGLMFLIETAVYTACSPFSGWLSDRYRKGKRQVISGFLLLSVAFFLLGPSPLLPGVPNVIWLNAVALVIHGLGMAFALIPTYQLMLDGAKSAGYKDDIVTNSMVSGIWVSCFSVGEILGPFIGGIFTDKLGFPIASTIASGINLTAAIGVFTFHMVWKDPVATEKQLMEESSVAPSYGSTLELNPEELDSMT